MIAIQMDDIILNMKTASTTFIVIVIVISIAFYFSLSFATSSPDAASASNTSIAISVIISWIVTICVVLPFTYQLLQKYNLEFYFFTQKLKYKFLPSRSATWHLSTRFESYSTVDIITEIEERMLRNYQGKIRVLRTSDRERFYIVDQRFNTEISIEPLQESMRLSNDQKATTAIYIHVLNLNVSYGESSLVLEHHLMPLVALVESTISPVDRNYSMTVKFEKNKNPFFGLYVQWLRPKNVDKFQIIISLDDYQEKDIVKISEASISITAYSPSAFQAMAKDFLTLSPELKKTLSAHS